MKKNKTEIQKEKENDIRKIENIVSGMQTPEIPDMGEEWGQLEKRIDMSGDTKILPLFTKTRIYAASIAGVVILLISLFTYFSTKEYNYRTSGEKLTVILKDSTKVYLNINSTISYSAGYGILNRKIKLNGEAYFQVKKGSKPFIVKTLAAQIKVTGTQFNVKARRNKTVVGVSEGRVEFSSATNNKSMVVLTKGLLSSCKVNNAPQPAMSVPVNEFTGWMQDRLIYDNATLREVISDIEEQFNIKISVTDAKVRKIEITGVLKGNSPEDVLQTLCLLIDKNYRLNKDIYEIY